MIITRGDLVQPAPPAHMAYDRTIVVFSPDGRLLQVEYARQAVKKGNTSLGIKTNNTIVLGAIRNTVDLGENSSHKKVYEIDSHIGVTTSGLLADARDIIDLARVRAQVNKVTYGVPISVNKVTDFIADRKHVVTQYAGVRPYGVGFLIGGIDEKGASLYETDPSGTIMEWKAQAIGRGSERAKKTIKAKYKEDMSTDAAVKLVIEALVSGEKALKPENLELAVITEKEFRRLGEEELKKLM